MRRRQLMRAGLATTGTATVAGCVGGQDDETDGGTTDTSGTDDGKGTQDAGEETSFPSYDLPSYSDWVAAENTDGSDTGVFFTHLNWAAINELDSDETAEDDDTAEVIEQIPILGLPLYGALITPIAIVGLLFYPFSGDILPEEGQETEGIETSAMTWTDGIIVFYGEYDPAVFADRYADGFEATEERDGFTVYVGNNEFTDGLAYAISDDTLIAGMHPGEDDEYIPEDIVVGALDRRVSGTDRVVDEDDGRWLFDTTGEAQMAFGAWETDDLMEALDPDDEVEEDVEDAEPDAEPDVEDNPVFDDVESLVNTLVFTVDDGEMSNIEARFSGLYPADAVPSEDDVREYLIGNPDVSHDIIIAENRVHATATFDDIDSA